MIGGRTKNSPPANRLRRLRGASVVNAAWPRTQTLWSYFFCCRRRAPARTTKPRSASVADIGSGTGYFSFRIAPRVPRGKVLAVDIQQEMLDLLTEAAKRRGVKNVEPVLGKIDDPNLPDSSTDVALMVDAYHEFDHPREMMEALVADLKPGGQIVLLEFRAEDPAVYIKPLHKMTEAQAVKEMEAVGLKHVETLKDLPWQHVMFFEKPPAKE